MQADVKFSVWKECFESLPDPRVQGRTQHRLIDILFLTLCGVTVGMDDFEGVEDWAMNDWTGCGSLLDWNTAFLRMTHWHGCLQHLTASSFKPALSGG